MFLLMVMYTKDSFQMEIDREKENTLGQIKVIIKEIGKVIK